jgi:hypothetical protein
MYLHHNSNSLYIDDWKKMCMQKFHTEKMSSSNMVNKFGSTCHYIHPHCKYLLHTFDKLNIDGLKSMYKQKTRTSLPRNLNRQYKQYSQMLIQRMHTSLSHMSCEASSRML